MTEKPKRPPRRRAHKKKPTERAVLGVVKKLVDPDTGELYRAIVAYAEMDRRLLQEKQLRIGDIVVLDVYKERNYRFYRLWHQLATYMIENHREFEGMKSHPALKKLQLDSDIHCEHQEQEIDLGTLGKHKVYIKQPLSLNFVDTDETKVQEIWEALCDHVVERYFGDWTPEQQDMARAHWEREDDAR